MTPMVTVLLVGVIWLIGSLVLGDVLDHVGTGLGVAICTVGLLGIIHLPLWVAMLAGAGAWASVEALDHVLHRSQTGALPANDTLVGRAITISKPSDKEGHNAQALVHFAGTSTELLIQNEELAPLHRGDEVWITAVKGNRATVRRAWAVYPDPDQPALPSSPNPFDR